MYDGYIQFFDLKNKIIVLNVVRVSPRTAQRVC